MGGKGKGKGKGMGKGKGRSGGVGPGSSPAAKVIDANKRIKRLGEARELGQAVAVFEELEAAGGAMAPTVVSYNVILFALVRCGELAQAAAVYTRMLAREKPPVRPTVVTLTTLLKGYCEAGDLPAAEQLLGQMADGQTLGPAARPNTRTLNAFLRGCLLTGDAHRAAAVHAKLLAAWVVPDAATTDYLLRLQAVALQLDAAAALAEAAEPDPPAGEKHIQRKKRLSSLH